MNVLNNIQQTQQEKKKSTERETGGLKVLHVIASLDPAGGGPMQAIRNYLSELRTRGIYHEVVCLDDPAASFLSQDDFTCYALGPSKRPWAYSRKLVPWLEQHLDQYEVVVVHGLWLYPGFAVHSLIQTRRKKQGYVPKYFFMPHGMLDPYFQQASGRKLKAARNRLYWEFIESKLIARADGLLFTCEEECRLARTTFGKYRPAAEYVIGFGITAPPPFNPVMEAAFDTRFPALAGRPFLLFLSRIHPKKGIDLLIDAYAKWHLQHGDLTPRLVVAGPGMETGFGAMIRGKVEKYALGSFVFFPGMITGDLKWSVFYKAEAFILPSHQENFGIAVAEALACSTPVLISNEVNIWSEVAAAGGGVVEEDTAEGTYALLEQWMRLPTEDRNRMRERAKNCYQNYFSMGPAVSRMLNVFYNETADIRSQSK